MEYPSGQNRVLDGVVRCTQYRESYLIIGFESHLWLQVLRRGEVTGGSAIR
jgi:hypothetical protein